MPDHPPPTDTDRLRRRNRELAILNSIAQALNREVDLPHALEAVLAQAADLLDLRTGWIWLLNEQTGAAYLAAAQNLPPALTGNPERMEGSCYCLDTYQQGDLDGAANVNVVTCSRLKRLVDGTDGLRFHASIPLYDHDRPIGVLNVASTDWRELSPEDLQLLHTIGDMLSIAVTRARLFAHSVEIGAVEERNRLARDIHDTLAQELAAITLQLETADLLLESGRNAGRIQRIVQQALFMTRNSLEEARRSVLDLRAAPLEGRGLAEALADLAGDVAQRSGLDVRVQVVGGGHPLSARVEGGLYRIAQEALTNVTRHAEASRADLRLEVTPGAVRLVVQDDGRGFDVNGLGAANGGRFGLRGMTERAHLIGGRLAVESTPGAGTRITVSVRDDSPADKEQQA